MVKLKNIKLISDSSCDLPLDIIEKYEIDIVHLNVMFDDESYIDGLDISPDEFYEKMASSINLPKTSSPSPERFLKAFECDEEKILVICLSSGLSSTYHNALMAKQMYLEDHPQKEIEVIDSKTGSLGVGIGVIEAARMIGEGIELEDIVAKMEKHFEDAHTYMYLDTLENAVKAGRVSAVKGIIASALNFKFIVRLEDGKVKFFEKIRGEKKVLHRLLDIIGEERVDTKGGILGICHSNALEKAEKVKRMAVEKYGFSEVVISEMSATIGSYASSGGVLIRF